MRQTALAVAASAVRGGGTAVIAAAAAARATSAVSAPGGGGSESREGNSGGSSSRWRESVKSRVWSVRSLSRHLHLHRAPLDGSSRAGDTCQVEGAGGRGLEDGRRHPPCLRCASASRRASRHGQGVQVAMAADSSILAQLRPVHRLSAYKCHPGCFWFD